MGKRGGELRIRPSDNRNHQIVEVCQICWTRRIYYAVKHDLLAHREFSSGRTGVIVDHGHNEVIAAVYLNVGDDVSRVQRVIDCYSYAESAGSAANSASHVQSCLETVRGQGYVHQIWVALGPNERQ